MHSNEGEKKIDAENILKTNFSGNKITKIMHLFVLLLLLFEGEYF